LGNEGSGTFNAQIEGIMVNNIVFVRSKYVYDNFDIDLKIANDLDIPPWLAGIKDTFKIRGYFNLNSCCYFCNLD